MADKVNLMKEKAVTLKIGPTPWGEMVACERVIKGYESGKYEGSVREIIEQELNHIHRFIDIGAGFGYFSRMVKTLKPDCKVIAVEAEPIRHACCQRNLWKFESGVYIVQALVGPKTLYLRQHPGGQMDARHHEPKETSIPFRNQFLHLKQLLLMENKFEVPGPTLIKLDVEGCEWDILQQLEPFYASHPLFHWIIETHAWRAHDLEEWETLFSGRRVEQLNNGGRLYVR